MSAPSRFVVPLKGKGRVLGTRAERAVLRFYFIAGGFDVALAEASVFRWSHATNRREFEKKVTQAVAWLEKVALG